MAKATTTTTTRPRLFPGRTISPNSSDGRNSTIRPSAASNARSGSGWNTGRSCDGRDSPTNRAGKKSATGTSPGIQTINDAVADFLNEARTVMVNAIATQRRGRPAIAERAPPSTGVQTAKVTADEAGMRVDRFVEARFPGLAFSHIQRIIRKGELRVNGKRAQPKQRLEAGQAVRLPPLRSEPRPPTPGGGAGAETRDFLNSITLHEDADLLVLDKPMGLAVQGGSGTTRHLDAMLETLRDARGQRPRLVHRLDKDTAGCLLVAKTRFAAAALAKTFRSRSARKIYWALVAGVPKPRQGRISTFLAKEEREDASFMRVARHGEEGASHAVTYYAVIDTAARQLAWLSLKPVTGRTHQLRAHMAHIGHPIVGDAKYFSKENWELPGGMQNRLHLLARRIVVPPEE